MKVHIEDQIACIQRELGMRRGVYERRVKAGKMSQDLADVEILRMEAVLDTLNDLQKSDTIPVWRRDTQTEMGL